MSNIFFVAEKGKKNCFFLDIKNTGPSFNFNSI